MDFDILSVINQVVILLLLMTTGLIAAKIGIIDRNTRKRVADILILITSPALVITSFQIEGTQDMRNGMILVAVFAIIAMPAMALLGKYLWKNSIESRRKVLMHSTIFSNCGYMGYPVLGSLFGNIGIIYASIYVAVFIIYLWTMGVHIYTKGTKNSVKWYKSILKPGLIAVVIGLVLFFTGLVLPSPIYATLNILGNMTTPLSMILIGALIAEIKLKDGFKDKAEWILIALRLIFIPLVILLALWFIPMPMMIKSICVLLVAMPVAANTAMFATKFGANDILAGKLVVMSTVISMITIPLWMIVLTTVLPA